MELWTAFTLGLVGSLHCGVMCGPLILAIPAGGLGRLVYNAGRITVYSLMGALLGLASSSFALAGFQRWVSLAAGAAILTGFFFSKNSFLVTRPWKLVVFLKSQFSNLLKRRSYRSLFCQGAINGLLPCGLVYVACAGAIASASFLGSIKFMLAFGIGTLPMILGISFARARLQPFFSMRLQPLIPVAILALGVLLVFRGLALGIPYLSPVISDSQPASAACH